MMHRRRWFLTPCGLDCYSCSIRLRTDEELAYWDTKGIDPDKIRCDGCRSERSGHHWSPRCRIVQCCVYERKYEFCAQCPDFPCHELDAWGAEYRHHAEAVERLHAMKQIGIEDWLTTHNLSEDENEAG